MIIAEVPLKLTLFGEHAVVYEQPALAMAISEKMIIKVKSNEKMIIKSNSLSIKGIKVDLNDLKLESEETGKILSYVIGALSYFKEKKNALIEIESPVDPSVGLGTSAAVIVGIVSAYSRFLGYELTNEEIAKISHNIELSIQGIGSRMDTYTTALGGLIYFPKDGGYEILDQNLELTAGYIKRVTTTKDILKYVRNMKEKNFEIFNDIINTIGKITDKAKNLIKDGNEEELGNLMYINHGLLMSLGVTYPLVDNLVSTAKNLGIRGCKISGGGGGGAIICTNDVKAEILLNTIGARIINCKKSEHGVMIKEIN
ncbi:mevalonate kinase [Acidianus brierleyi]|uniref:Mevalonate kinase n=1 Tax=Acidianus brierleyi TaxID=41673 RepID=A0A2U9IFT0_9CREN|nr:mevalonate kinase [Acidianus brierleyi]AWR94873.1 mevalonate kinase [Acidianus brierleyi]